MVANLEATERPTPHAPSDASHYSDPAHVEALALLDKLQIVGNKPGVEPGYLDFGTAAELFPPSSSSQRLSPASESHGPENSFSKGKQTAPADSPVPSDHNGASKPASDSSAVQQTSDASAPQPTLESARGNLLAVASKNITGPGQFQVFEHDMTAFEQRMTQESPVEVQQFYTQMARLMSEPSTVMSESNKMLLAEGMMHDAANPDAIRQGASQDCVSASLESRAYTQAPGETAKMMTDVALTGSYTTSDGRVITPTTGINEPIKNDQFGGAERSLSDQVFQVTAMNTYMDGKNQRENTPGRYEYKIGPSPVPELPYVEEQIDNSTHPPTTNDIEGISDLTGKSLSQLYQKMTGIASGDFLIDQDTDGSLPQIQQRLIAAGQTGQFPLEAGVNSESQLLDPDFDAIKNSAMYKEFAKDLSTYHKTPEEIENLARTGGHAIAIEGYDPKTQTVTYMDPELGTESKTDLADFVKAMDIVPYPQSEDKFNKFLESENSNKPFDEQAVDFLKTIPKAQRQEIASELITDGELYPDDLSASEYHSLGMTAPDSSDQ